LSINSKRKLKHEVLNRLKNERKISKRKNVLKHRYDREKFIAPKREIYFKHEAERQKALKESVEAQEKDKAMNQATITADNAEIN